MSRRGGMRCEKIVCLLLILSSRVVPGYRRFSHDDSSRMRIQPSSLDVNLAAIKTRFTSSSSEADGRRGGVRTEAKMVPGDDRSLSHFLPRLARSADAGFPFFGVQNETSQQEGDVVGPVASTAGAGGGTGAARVPAPPPSSRRKTTATGPPRSPTRFPVAVVVAAGGGGGKPQPGREKDLYEEAADPGQYLTSRRKYAAFQRMAVTSFAGSVFFFAAFMGFVCWKPIRGDPTSGSDAG